MIDTASFLHTVVSHGYTPAGIPPSLSLSAGGSKLEDPRWTALKTTGFPSCPKAGRANAAAELPQVLLSQAWADPDAPRLAEQVLLCPHDLPAEVWNWYQSWDDISCGQRMGIPVTISQQTEHLPRSLKGHFILNSSYPASRHPILGFTSLTCAGTWSFSSHADPAPRCHSRDSLQTDESYVSCAFLVGSCRDHIHKKHRGMLPKTCDSQ